MAEYNANVILLTQFVLSMSSMFNCNLHPEIIRVANTKEELLDFYNNELVDPYDEEIPFYLVDPFDNPFKPRFIENGKKIFHKSFRKGGPLENFIPLKQEEFDNVNIGSVGIYESSPKIKEIINKIPIY